MRINEKRICTFIATLLFLLTLFLPGLAGVSDVYHEKDLQRELEHGRAEIKRAKEKHGKGRPVKDELKSLKAGLDNLRTTHILLYERFRLREGEVRALGPKAVERHRLMQEKYADTVEKYLHLADSLPAEGKISEEHIDKMNDFFAKNIHRKKMPLLGSLPYRHLNYPSKEPAADPPVKPAYKGGDMTVRPDDLKNTEEAPISEDIAELAQSLDWNPVLIYEYVKNNIETEWYFGCMKGAEETLRQKSGNDCDQAVLLAALLRASGFPSRYVRGTIEFFAGKDVPVNKIRNLLGIEDPWKIAEFFRKAGIPFKPVIAGGSIANFQIEHIWVESLIPYANYRGTVIDGHGNTWLGLDTSIKVKDYLYNTPADVFGHPELVSGPFSNIRNEYLCITQTQTPLEYLRAHMNSELNTLNSGLTYNDLLKTKTLAPEVMNILPASMQFDQKRITHEYTEIPEKFKHKVRFTAKSIYGDNLFDITFNTMNLSNKKIALIYEAETVEDQQIINAYGGLDGTPAYLVRLRPVLKVNGERITVATDGLPMGADYDLIIELISPSGTERITSAHIVGNLAVIGIIAQKAVSDQLSVISEQDDAETILYKEAISYIDRWNQAEDELASLMHLAFTRPVPTVVTVGGVIDVTYVLDTPHGFLWKGIYADANLRAIETVGAYGHTPANDRHKIFMELSALQGSVLEHKLFEDDLHVESISTAKLFEIANSNQVTLLTIDKTNISTVLPTLPFADNVREDIINAVNQNRKVTIPDREITYRDWAGIGYIKENPETGESGYMLSGMIAGAMTAVSPDKWGNRYLAELLGEPYGSTYNTIVITSPKNGAVLTASPITVSGIVLDPKVKVTVNGAEASVDGSTFTVSGIALEHGTNIIRAIGTDQAGKQISEAIIVRYEPPVAIYVTFPYDGAGISVTPIYVEGIVSDPSVSVSVNGIRASVSADGRFISEGVQLAEGLNRITAGAINAGGKTSSHTININYRNDPVAPIFVSITSPEANAAINRPDTLVRGTVTTDAGEVSVKVNGIGAEIYGNRFTANKVPLTEGLNRIIVNALGSNGAIGRAEVTVNAVTSGPGVSLTANITSGISPLTTYFSESTEMPDSAETYSMDFEGDGITDYTGTDFEDISHAYSTEGIYYPTLTVTDNQGNTYSDTIAITVMNKAQIDALLKSKWEGMKAALGQGDINGALNYFLKRSRDEYNEIFELLAPHLSSLVSEMKEINMTEVVQHVAEYYITRPQRGSDISYFIYFARDADGVWKIDRF